MILETQGFLKPYPFIQQDVYFPARRAFPGSPLPVPTAHTIQAQPTGHCRIQGQEKLRQGPGFTSAPSDKLCLLSGFKNLSPALQSSIQGSGLNGSKKPGLQVTSTVKQSSDAKCHDIIPHAMAVWQAKYDCTSAMSCDSIQS